MLKKSKPTRLGAAKAYRDKMLAAGYVQCNVWVPQGAVPELQAAAQTMRERPDATGVRLVSQVTGRLVKVAR